MKRWGSILLVMILVACGSDPKKELRVGTKNFPEQLLLGDLLAVNLQSAGIPVRRLPGFGSTSLIHGAMARGDVDLYVEYSGTAEQAILKVESLGDVKESRLRLQKIYREQFKALWGEPLGFENGYVLVVPFGSGEARMSDYAKKSQTLKAGFNSEFVQRADGFPLLNKVYGMNFASVVTLDVGLMYKALDEKKVDVVVGFGTDGVLASGRYAVLQDDLNCFPLYEATPVVRLEALETFAQLEGVLKELAGRFDTVTMRQLNARVASGEGTRKVAEEYWAQAR